MTDRIVLILVKNWGIVMNLFDVLGPVMIGPSSSHTAGAVRLGNLALAILGGSLSEAKVGLHGSFAETYRGHGTDLALAAGLQGWRPDDPRIPDSFAYAAAAGITIQFEMINLGDLAHPNSVFMRLTNREGTYCHVTGASIGGGRVIITEVDDFPLELTGEYPTLLVVHHDRPGAIALVTSILSNQGVNIAQMRVFRKLKGGSALMVVETDQAVGSGEIRAMSALPSIIAIRAINAI